jgi:hypothetical protein
MQLEYELPSGGRVDCLNPNFAIEVEWAHKWAESVGQSLYYAAATDRKPGIILLCTQSEGPVEGLCRSYVYRLEYALKFVPTHVQVWTCAVDKDRTLNDCFEPTIQEPAVREHVHIEQPAPVKENRLLKPLPSGSPRLQGIGD